MYNIHVVFHACPLVYGVWHAYKYTVLATCRAFCPIVTYLRFGTVAIGHKTPAHLKLIVLEKFIAACILGSGDMLHGLRRKRNTTWAQRNITDRHEARYQVAVAFHIFLTKYCALLLYLGFICRQCNWEGMRPSTAWYSHEILCTSCPLLRLGAPANSPCYRTIPLAPSMWSQWHDRGPGVMHAEKF